jgi:hypothetical protein
MGVIGRSSSPADIARGSPTAGPPRTWPLRVGLILLLGIVGVQSWAYYRVFPLLLGPRVILQPWLLQRGFVMYENISDIHSPMMSLVLAMLRQVMPDGLRLARLVLVALLALSTILTFAVGWRKAGWLYGLWAAGFVAAWSPSFRFDILWHETFLAVLYLLLFLLYDTSNSHRSAKSSLLAGFLGGVAVLFKQHAILVFGVFVIWSAGTNWYFHRSIPLLLREVGFLGAAALVPVVACLVYEDLQAGSLAGLVKWTVDYPLTSDYKSLAALSPTTSQLKIVASSCLLVPAAIACGVASIRNGDKAWLDIGLGLVLALASSATAYPRFELFHLQAALPLLASLSAVTFAYLLGLGRLPRFFPMTILIALSGFWLLTAGAAYKPILSPPAQQTVHQYSELVPLAREIRKRIGPTDCLYIFPDTEEVSNLYYLLQCDPPKFWIFSYPWYMDQPTKNRIIATLQASPPQWVAYFPNRWSAEKTAPEIVAYIQDHYERTTFQSDAADMQLFMRLP